MAGWLFVVESGWRWYRRINITRVTNFPNGICVANKEITITPWMPPPQPTNTQRHRHDEWLYGLDCHHYRREGYPRNRMDEGGVTAANNSESSIIRCTCYGTPTKYVWIFLPTFLPHSFPSFHRPTMQCTSCNSRIRSPWQARRIWWLYWANYRFILNDILFLLRFFCCSYSSSPVNQWNG